MPALSKIDLQLFKALTMATGWGTTDIGGGRSTSQITASTIGEVFFSMAANLAGGGDLLQHQKVHWWNDHASDPFEQAVVYGENFIDDLPSSGQLTVRGTSVSQGATYKNVLLGFDGSTSQSEDVVMDGTNSVASLLDWTALRRAEHRLTGSGSLTPSISTVDFLRLSTEIANMLLGYWSITGEVGIWLPATLDDTGTNGSGNNAAVPPGSSTFTRPRLPADGLAVANGQILTAQHSQGAWLVLEVLEDSKPSRDCQVGLALYGQAPGSS